jgi:hypothetical protein
LESKPQIFPHAWTFPGDEENSAPMQIIPLASMGKFLHGLAVDISPYTNLLVKRKYLDGLATDIDGEISA